MDKAEARKVLAEELQRWRTRPYNELVSLIGGEPFTKEVPGGSGVTYQIEIEVVWDHKPGGMSESWGQLMMVVGEHSFRSVMTSFFPQTDVSSVNEPWAIYQANATDRLRRPLRRQSVRRLTAFMVS